MNIFAFKIIAILIFIYCQKIFAECDVHYNSNVEFDKFKKRNEREMAFFVDNYLSNHYIDTLCYNDIELNKLKKKLNPEIAEFADFYCLKKKGIKEYDPLCKDSFGEKEKQELQSDDYYKDVRAYEKQGFLTSCDDTLNVKEREIDPRPHGGFDNTCNSDYFIYLMLNNKLVHKREETSIYTDIDDGIKEITKRIHCERDCKTFEEKIVTRYDKKGDLLFSRHCKWNGRMLVQTIEDGVVRKIVPGKTRCDFTIIEPSGDSISFRLDPKQELDASIKIRNLFNFVDYMNDPKFEVGKYDAIIYQWYSFCIR